MGGLTVGIGEAGPRGATQPQGCPLLLLWSTPKGSLDKGQRFRREIVFHLFMSQVYGSWVQDTPGSKLTPSQPHPGVMARMQSVYGCGPHPGQCCPQGHCTMMGHV